MPHWTKAAVTASLMAALLCTALSARPGLFLRAGAQVSGPAGLTVTAPPRWRPAGVQRVQVRVQTVPEAALPVPLPSGVTLATPVYRVQARPAVQTADAGRFEIRLPVKGGILVPLRLSTDAADRAPGASTPPRAMWVSDSQARVQGGLVVFQTTTLSPEPQYFAVIRIAD